MFNCVRRIWLVVLCCVVFAVAASSTQAASGTWNGTNNANWADPNNWSVSPVPGVADTATFSNDGNGNTTVNFSGNTAVRVLMFDTANAASYTVGSGAMNSQTLIIGGSGGINMTGSVVADQTINALIKLGTGATAGSFYFTNNSDSSNLILAGIQSNTGGTAAAKTVVFGGTGAGQIQVKGSIIGTGGMTLTNTFAGTLSIYGTSTVTTLNMNGGAGSILDINGATLFLNNAGSTTLTSSTGGIINGSNGGTIYFSTTGTNYADNQVAAGKTLIINAKISAAAGFEVYGNTGTFVFNNPLNDYSGDTTFNAAGTIQAVSIGNVGVASALGAGTNILFSSAGAKIIYVGTGDTTNRNILLNANATIDQSGTGGTLKFAGLVNNGTGARTLTLQGSNPGIGELASNLSDRTTTYTTAITKSGSGTWILSGNNTHTGATTVNDGTLILNNANALPATTANLTVHGVLDIALDTNLAVGALVGTGVIDNISGAAVAHNLTVGGGNASGTFGGAISNTVGTTSLIKVGTGIQTLSGNSTYSGGTTISLGGINVTRDQALGDPSGGILFNGTGVSVLQSSISGVVLNSARTITINPGATATMDASAGADMTISGLVTGTGAVNKTGAGAVYLAGTNDYLGNTTVSAGALSFSNVAARPAAGLVTVATGATLGLGVGGAGYFSSADVDSLFANTVSGVTMSNGSYVGVDTSAGNFAYTAGVTSAFGLQKLGANTLMLTGTAAYTGNTAIIAGTLQIESPAALSAGTVQIAAGGTFDLNGQTVSNNISLGGTGVIINSSSTDAIITSNMVLPASGGLIGGSGNITVQNITSQTLTKFGPGTLTLAGSSDNTSMSMVIVGGTVDVLKSTGSGGVRAFSSVTLNGGTLRNVGTGGMDMWWSALIMGGGTFDLYGNNMNIVGSGYLTGTASTAGVITNNGTGQATFTLTKANNSIFGGVIQDGSAPLAIAKMGSGVLTLTNTNSFTGGLTLGGGATVNINGEQALGAITGAITFNGPGVIQMATGIGSLTLSNRTITTNTGGVAGFDTNSNPLLTIPGSIVGTGGVSKSGAGMLILSGDNSYFGPTTVYNGTLQVGGATAINAASTVSVLTNTSGGTSVLDLNDNSQTLNNVLTLGGASGASATSVANVTLGQAVLALNNGVTFVSTNNPLGSTISAGGTGSVDLNGGVRTFTVGDSTTATYDLTISAPILNGGFTKAGAGVLMLSGANSFTGPTTINSGQVYYSNPAALGSTTRNITANAGTVVALGFAGISSSASLLNMNANSVLALTSANSGEDVDMSATGWNMPGAWLGSFGAITYTGMLTPYGGVYRLGGASNSDITLGTTNQLTGAGNSLVVGNSAISNGTVRLLASNDYAGGTTLQSNTLQFANGALGSGPLTFTYGRLQWASGNTQDVSGNGMTFVNSGYLDTNGNNVTLASPMTGPGGFAKEGAGTLTLGGANTITGAITISGGTLRLGNANALKYNTTTVGGAGTLGFGGIAGATFTVGAISGTAGGSISLLDPNGVPVNLVMATDSATTIASIISGAGGSFSRTSLNRATPGTTTLTNANTYTGATYVSGAQAVGGGVTLDFSPNITASQIVSASSQLVLGGSGSMGGATVVIKGGSGKTNTQNFNGLAVGQGQSFLQISQNNAANISVNVGAITRADNGAIDFTLPTTGTGAVKATYAPGLTNGILGGWATVSPSTAAGSSMDWATLSGGNVVAYTGYKIGTGAYTIASDANTNVSVAATTGNITVPSGAGAVTDINTFRFADAANARTMAFSNAAGILRFGAVGGILTQGTAKALTIGASVNSGILTAGGADNTPGELVINTGNSGNGTTGMMTINSRIMDNGTGAVTLVKTGASQVTLSGSNSYTGGTIVEMGRVAVGSNITAFGTGNVTVKSGGQIYMTGGTWANNFIISGNGTTENVNFGALRVDNSTLTGTITLMNDAAIGTSAANATIGAKVTGPGALMREGGNPVIYTNSANDFTGGIVLAGGTLQFNNLGSMGTGAIVHTGGTMVLNFSGIQSTLNRYTPTSSGGVIALTAASQGDNIDLSPTGANLTPSSYFYLGAGASGVTFTGTLTSNSSIVRLGGGGYSLTMAGTNQITGSQSVYINNNTVIFTMPNDYTGGTMLWGGGLNFKDDNNIGNGPVTFAANSTLTFASGNTASALGLTINAGITGTLDTGANASVTHSGIISGTGALTKSGTGVLILPSLSATTENNYAGNTTINGGTLTITNTAPTLAGGLTFGASAYSTSAVTLDLTQVGATFNGQGTVQTNGVGVINSILVGTGNTLTINNGLKLGIDATGATATKLTVSGGGSLVVVGSGVQIGVSQSATNGSNNSQGTLDLSNLGGFNSSTTFFNVGQGATSAGTLLLTNGTNNITATTMNVGNSAGQNGSGSGGIITLGTGINNILADTINIGMSKISGQIAFASQAGGSPGEVVINSKAGTGGANITVASNNGTGTAAAISGILDLRGHTSTVTAGSLTVGYCNNNGSGSATGTVNFDTGTFTVSGPMQLGYKSNLVDPNNPNATGSGTINLSGGGITVLPTGSITLGNCTSIGKAYGAINITGGIFTSNVDILRGGGTGNATATVTLNGGTLDMVGNDIGSQALPIDVLTFQAGTLQNVNSINGSGALNKTGTGVLYLAGSNSFSGGLNIIGGILNASSDSALGAVTGGVTLMDATTLQAGADAILANASRMVQLGTGVGTNATIDTQDYGMTLAGRITGEGNLIKIGSGILTLSGTSDYTGTTSVNNGILKINGSLASSSVTVSSGATLGGSGSLSGSLNVLSGGHLAPGNSIGTLNVGDTTLAGTYDIELGAMPGSPSRTNVGLSDLTNVTGNLTLNGVTWNLVDNDGNNSNGYVSPGSYRVFTYTGTLGGSSILPVTAAVNHGGTPYHAQIADAGSSTDPGKGIFVDVYSLASAGAIASPGNLGKVIKGGSLSANLSVNNPASVTYSEGLNAGIGTVSAGLTAGGSITNLSGGGTDSTSLVVGLDSSTPGAKSGTVQITLASNGTNSGWGSNTGLTSQDVNVSGTVLDHSKGSFSLSTDSNTISRNFNDVFGTINKGSGSCSIELTLFNIDVTPSYTAGLRWVSTDANHVDSPFTIDSMTSLTNLAAGDPDGFKFKVYLNTENTGTFSGYFTIVLGDQADLAGHLDDQSVRIDVTGTVVIPEPATMGLLLLGGMGVLARRRRQV